MRRFVAFCIVLSMMLTIAGCDQPQVETYPSMTAYLAVPEVYQTAVTNPQQYEPVTAEMAFTNGENGIDIDLTVLSSTMVYSMVYCMLTAPDEYTGMVVKMRGLSSSFHDEDNDIWYYACVVQDATACCQQGIEYELTDDYACPDDYPVDGQDICVIGTFDTYLDNGNTYYVLREGRLE